MAGTMLKRAALKLWPLASAIWLSNFIPLAALQVDKKSASKKNRHFLSAGFFILVNPSHST
jgi:hypothetical protein